MAPATSTKLTYEDYCLLPDDGRRHDVVIEVLSDSNRNYDQLVKYKTYERWGVAEYWIADPDAETVTMYRRSGGAFVRVETGDTVTTPLIQDFALPLREIFG